MTRNTGFPYAGTVAYQIIAQNEQIAQERLLLKDRRLFLFDEEFGYTLVTNYSEDDLPFCEIEFRLGFVLFGQREIDRVVNELNGLSSCKKGSGIRFWTQKRDAFARMWKIGQEIEVLEVFKESSIANIKGVDRFKIEMSEKHPGTEFTASPRDLFLFFAASEIEDISVLREKLVPPKNNAVTTLSCSDLPMFSMQLSWEFSALHAKAEWNSFANWDDIAEGSIKWKSLTQRLLRRINNALVDAIDGKSNSGK